METLLLYTDGGARGNPGPAAVGIVIKNEKGETLKKVGRAIGVKTNNEAEYQALIEGLTLAKEFNPQKVICFLDSSLVANQLNGRFKIKKAHLQTLLFEVQKLAQDFTRVDFKYIPREKNQEADKLVNEALDRHQDSS